ncbi:MAG: AAA family ATPase [Deltaproteobacteria bacterium]|jgi:hypothetical protein|nr:AAA family ATPase [Deltaproteobacteria bacterium]
MAEFSSLINNNYIYVDKTEFVNRLLTDSRHHLLLSRPRRLGKTLLIDTIEEVLTGRRELFSGLEIDKLRGENYWPRSHVLRMNLNPFTGDPSSLDMRLANCLRRFANPRGINLTSTCAADSLIELLETMHSNYNKIPLITRHINLSDNIKADIQKIDVLIDEYDSPVINNLTNSSYLKTAKSTLHSFYNALKSCEDLSDRIFITGITKFAQLSAFSALNNLDDISFDENYAAICGFTDTDITKYYYPHLQNTLKKLQQNTHFGPSFTFEKLIKRIADWYDGYSWDGINHVINPLSLNYFLINNRFDNYWSQTGGTNFLDQMNIKDNIFSTVFQGKPTFSGSLAVQDAGNADPISVMLQTGYLTVRSQKISKEISRLYLTVPNKEVGMTIMNNYIHSHVEPIIEHATDAFNIKMCNKFSEVFFKRQSNNAEIFLSKIFSSIPYSLHLPFEAFYHSLLFSIFRTAQVDAVPKVNKANGIIDLVVTSQEYGIMVTEIKYAKSNAKITEDSNVDDKKRATKITEKDK